jgi:uncharacterized protein
MNYSSLSLQRTIAHLYMSPRSTRIRKVFSPPLIKGFKPYGPELEKGSNQNPVVMLYEEYEALRLCDYDLFNHHRSSVVMGISRPTFTRIYASARQKIALAIVEGRQITIEGGKVYFDSDWYHCNNCTCYFNNPEKDITIETCPLCKSSNVNSYEPQASLLLDGERRCGNTCLCPACGFEQPHPYGEPCGSHICPKCKTRMTRKGTPGRGRKNK